MISREYMLGKLSNYYQSSPQLRDEAYWSTVRAFDALQPGKPSVADNAYYGRIAYEACKPVTFAWIWYEYCQALPMASLEAVYTSVFGED